MKAILIARVSTEEQRDAGNSLPAQMDRLERYCQNNDLEIIEKFEFDESAYKNKRSEFDKIVDFIVTSDGLVINGRISAAEKFQFSMTLGLAKYYSDAVSDNVGRSFEQKKKKWEWLSKAPLGYKNISKRNGVESNVVLDEDKSSIVRTMFELYATKSYSMELLRLKIKEEFGVDISKGSIGKILKKPFYYGEMIIKGKIYPHRY